LRQVLAPKVDNIDGQLTDTNQKKREDFYSALTAFSNCLKVALQSATYFEDKSFDDKRELYKKALKSMSELRKQVREDAEETVNYDAYAESIRTMLDKHIGGVEIQESEGVYLVGNMGKDAKPKDMSDDEARNKKDAITGRVTKMIEQDLADDPYAQEYFSNLLKKAIEQAKEMFDAPAKQYLLFADFEEQVKERKVEGMPSERFDDLNPKVKRHVQAYYGLFLKHLDDVSNLSEDERFDFSMAIDEVVTSAVAEFSINPQEIEKQINRQLLPMMFKAIGMNAAKTIINDVIQITRLGVAGYHS
ncbi:MAG: type I restriction endonuclease subunit R, partial [Shewanella sp.]|nr:type I restriction endonuclease subunit R [Shewanella sp.]